MALEQRKYQTSYIHEMETTIDERTIQTPVRPSRKIFSTGEKFLFMLFSATLVLVATLILHTQAQINETNREVQLLGRDIDKIEKQNTELSIQVSEKSTYEVIWEKAKELGLNLNENNVKVVPGR